MKAYRCWLVFPDGFATFASSPCELCERAIEIRDRQQRLHPYRSRAGDLIMRFEVREETLPWIHTLSKGDQIVVNRVVRGLDNETTLVEELS